MTGSQWLLPLAGLDASSGAKARCPQCELVILVNPGSGGGQAAAYLEELGAGSQPAAVSVGGGGTPAQAAVAVRAFDLRHGPSGSKPGCLRVKQLSSQGGPVRVMVAGGDGTVVWALSELIKAGADMARVAVGHIPFGTGNDFSRSTGWGPGAPSDPIGPGWEVLRRDVEEWMRADIVDFDLWEVSVTTTAKGGFRFPHQEGLGLTEADKRQHGLQELAGGWQMRKPMLNYFSLGPTCRAGLGFEQARTGSRFGNNVRYAWEGLKTLALRSTPLVSDILEELAVAAQPEHGAISPGWNHPYSDCPGIGQPSPAMWLSGFAHNSGPDGSGGGWGARIGFGDGADRGAVARSASQSAELVFLNVPSYAGGADPWAWAAPYAAARAAPGEAVAPAPAQLSAQSLEDLWSQARADAQAESEMKVQELVSPLDPCQSFGDGKLEVLTYSTGFDAATDAANGKVRVPGRGGGQRLACAHGPFVANFKPGDDLRRASVDGQVYFQVDGEFFAAVEPQQAVVRHLQTVRVLQRRAARAD